jgi:dipeptidyl aminopeptidase/acylaminoacyl peptidase
MDDPMTRMLSLRQTLVQDVDDGGRVLVVNNDSGSMQLSEIALDGTWRRLTDLSDPVTGRYLPGAPRRAVASVDPGGSERTQLWLLELDGPATDSPATSALTDDPDHIHELLAVAEDTVVFTTNRRDGVEFDIVRLTVSTRQEQVLYDGGGSFAEIAVSPSGRWLAATRMTLIAASSQLLLIDTTDGSVEEITDAANPGECMQVHWLDDAGLIASTDMGSERLQVRRFDLATREWQVEAADDNVDVSAIPAVPGSRWAVIRSAVGLDRLEIRGPDGSVTPVELPGPGVISGYHLQSSWAPGGGWFGFTFSSVDQPPEAYTWSEATGVSRRSRSNDDSELPDLVAPSAALVESFDGEQVPIFVIRGPHPDGSAVLVIHGGPEGEARLQWNPHVAGLALAGHTVVVPNVRGSAGYGRRWLALDDVELRLDSVADLAAIHRWLPTIEVDPRRTALWGGSYGGYMVLAGLTFHAGLFAAGVDIVGMSSLTTFMENTSSYRRVYREREYGSLAHHRQVLDSASPLPIIDRLSVPLFVIHGRNDPRVPVTEAEQVAAAVRANGAECDLLVYDDEGHGLQKRVNQLDAYPRAAAFLARHLAA